MASIKVALAPFLRACPGVVTLGIRATIDDYSADEKDLLLGAERVFFPTHRFAYLFNALRIPTFPAYTTYRFQRSRVLQEILLACTGMPHPSTRIYYGLRQKGKILNDFALPCVAMGPNMDQHGRHLIEDPTTLAEYARRYNPLIIREAVEWSEHVLIMWVHDDCPGAVSKSTRNGQNPVYAPVPPQHPGLHSIFEMTVGFVRKVHLDDIVLEWAYGRGKWQLLEIRRPPVRWPTSEGILDRHQYICSLVGAGRL